MEASAKTRVDKWLWATRWFKTRSLAADACTSGKIKAEGQTLKPSANVTQGMLLQITRNHIKHTIRVIKVIEKRVGAPEAQACFEDLTPPEEREKFNPAFFFHFEVREKGAGRPTKKERREIDKFKDDVD